ARIKMPAPDDQREPEDQQVPARPQEAPVVEEFRLSEGTVVMVHRDLGDPEAGILDLLDHLDADDSARLLEVDALEDVAPHQTEIAVDVPKLEAEQHADDVMIDASDHDPMERIGAADLVAVHEVRAGGHLLPQQTQFAWI